MSIVIDPGDGTATDTLQSTDAPLSPALRRGLDGGGLPLESPEESQASQADAPVSLVGPDFFPAGRAEIPQSAEPPQEMLDAAFGGNDWDTQQSEHDAALARHYRESQEQIDQAALRGEQYFQEDDLSFAPDAATGAMLGTNDMFLRTYTGGAPVPVSGAQRRLAILQTSIARFGEPLDTDEALFSRLQSDARYHADAGVLAQTLALNARQSALLQQVEPQRAAGFTWEAFRRQALKSPGYRDGDDSFLYDAWQDIHRQSREEFQSVAPAIGQVWQAIREGGAGTPSEIGKAFLGDLFPDGNGGIFEDTKRQLARKDAGALAGRLYYELSPSQRATFMDGLGVLARTFPKEEQARFFSNLAKEGGRAVDDLVRNIASVPASGDDIIGFGDFGIGTDTTEKLRREWKEKRPEMLAARNFASDVRRIEREEYAPLKSAWGDGAPGMIESGLYAIPGVAASVGLASIPYAGELALYSSMEGSAYDGLRDQLRRSGLDDERASALADEWSGVVAAPMAALGRLQAGAVLRRTPYLERLLPKIGTLFESSVVRFTARTALSTVEQTGMQLVQEQIPYALQDFQSRLSPLIPGVEWRNGRDGPLDGLWTRAGSAAIAGLPLALFIGLHGLHRDASSRGIAATSDIERRALGITPEASAAIDAAKGRGQSALNTAVSEALATRNPESIHARAALEELKARDEERRRAGDPAKAGYPVLKRVPEGIAVEDAESGRTVGTAPDWGGALKLAQTHYEVIGEFRSPEPGTGAGPHSDPLYRFSDLLKRTREVFQKLLPQLGTTEMPARIQPGEFGWTTAENRHDFHDELAKYAAKIPAAGKSPEQVYREIGEFQFEVFRQIGIDPSRLTEALREIESRSGLPLLPADLESLSTSARNLKIRAALGDAMAHFAMDEGIKAADLPAAFRPWFENRREIADLAILGFKGGLDLYRMEDRYLRPPEINSNRIYWKDVEPKKYSDGIVDAAKKRILEGNPDRLVDVEGTASGEAYQLTDYMWEMLRSEFEITAVYGSDKSLKDTRRGERHKVKVLSSDVEEGNTVFHNHPTPGMPPSTQDFGIFLLNPKAKYGVLVNEEDGSVTMHLIQAHPERKFPGLEPGERDVQWKEFAEALVDAHERTCATGMHSLPALREATREALFLLGRQAGDSVTIKSINISRE